MGILWDVANLEGGTTTEAEYDPVDDILTIHNYQDCEPTIKLNKELYNKGDGGYGPTREWRRAASIPNIILEKWLLEENIKWWDSEDTPKMMAKLDDPEYRYLRTAPGKLSRKPVRSYFKGSTS